MDVKELKEEFDGVGEVSGFHFIQKMKNDYAYLYEVHNPNVVEPHYEVFERRVNTMYDCVSYPKSNAFGVWAWCIVSYDRALEKFKEITELAEIKNENGESNECD